MDGNSKNNGSPKRRKEQKKISLNKRIGRVAESVALLAGGMDQVKETANRALCLQVEIMKMLQEKGILTDEECTAVLQRAAEGAAGRPHKPQDGLSGKAPPEQRKPRILPSKGNGGTDTGDGEPSRS